jgi:hypothetical protein
MIAARALFALLAAVCLSPALQAAAPVAGTGDQELPKVLYIVPWKDADIGAPVPPPQLSPEVFELRAVNRDSFRQQLRYQTGAPQTSPALPRP